MNLPFKLRRKYTDLRGNKANDLKEIEDERLPYLFDEVVVELLGLLKDSFYRFNKTDGYRTVKETVFGA